MPFNRVIILFEFTHTWSFISQTRSRTLSEFIKIWQNGIQLFLNIADWCHVLFLTCLKAEI